MPYYIGYKGKKLGYPMTKEEAEAKLIVLSRCFKQLEIIKEHSAVFKLAETQKQYAMKK